MSKQRKGKKKGALPSQGGPESTPSKDPGPPPRVDVKEEHKKALSVEGLSQQEIVDKIEAKLARPRGRPKGGSKESINLSLDRWVVEYLKEEGEKGNPPGPSSIANAILARAIRARVKAVKQD